MVHKSSRCRLALNLHSSIFHQSSALENQFLLKCITTDQSVWESHHRNSFGISRKLQNGLDQLQQYCVNSFSSGLRVTDVDVKITSSLVGVSSKHWLQENCMWSILKSLKSYFPLLCCVLVTYSGLKKTKTVCYKASWWPDRAANSTIWAQMRPDLCSIVGIVKKVIQYKKYWINWFNYSTCNVTHILNCVFE